MGEVRTDTILHRPLDAEALAKCPRVSVAAAALHQARRESYEKAGRIMLNKTWDEMWPEYQSQLRREAQAIVWAIDAFDRAALSDQPADRTRT